MITSHFYWSHLYRINTQKQLCNKHKTASSAEGYEIFIIEDDFVDGMSYITPEWPN